MSGADQSAWPRHASRAIVATFGFALLFTASVPLADPAEATDLSAQISAARRSQRSSEQVMRSQDRQLVKIKRQRKVTKRNLKRATKALKQTKKRLAGSRRTVSVRQERLADVEARHPDANEAPDPDAYKERLRKLRRDLRIAQKRKQALGKQVRRITRAKRARQRRMAGLKRQQRLAVARRKSAEGALAASIVHMTRLAQARVTNQTDLNLTSDGSTFAWPSTGRISQRFGCTGVRFYPRRGSCRHFHDGIDIVSAYGSSVRAAAIGVVAYVGWNPWDQRKRAFIVVVGHPDGFVTRYGHLTPTRIVRVGQLVKKGQRIGRMGNTGFSTGTHLHMELLRGNTPVDPMAYLPTGVVNSTSPKRSSDKKKASARQQRAEKRAKQKRARERRVQAERARSKRAGEGGQQSHASEQAAEREGRRGDGTADATTELRPPFPTVVASCEPGPGSGAEPDQRNTLDDGGVVRELATDVATDAVSDCGRDDPVPVAEVAERSVEQPTGPSIPSRGTSPTPH